jgi:hypothetical protein
MTGNEGNRQSPVEQPWNDCSRQLTNAKINGSNFKRKGIWIASKYLLKSVELLHWLRHISRNPLKGPLCKMSSLHFHRVLAEHSELLLQIAGFFNSAQLFAEEHPCAGSHVQQPLQPPPATCNRVPPPSVMSRKTPDLTKHTWWRATGSVWTCTQITLWWEIVVKATFNTNIISSKSNWHHIPLMWWVRKLHCLTMTKHQAKRHPGSL